MNGQTIWEIIWMVLEAGGLASIVAFIQLKTKKTEKKIDNSIANDKMLNQVKRAQHKLSCQKLSLIADLCYKDYTPEEKLAIREQIRILDVQSEELDRQLEKYYEKEL